MADFPDLSILPDAKGWEEGPLYDPTERFGNQVGPYSTRSKVTAVPYYWKFNYSDMPDADKVALQAHEKTQRYGGNAFNWTNPMDSVVYSVVYGSILLFDLEDTQLKRWRTKTPVYLIESLPTS